MEIKKLAALSMSTLARGVDREYLLLSSVIAVL